MGNDVVDLADRRCVGKSGDRRFLARILAPEEAGRIRESSRPDTLLWLFWAAKEAAYKVASKLESEPPPFVHADFRVALGDRPLRPGARGRVSWREMELPFRASVEAERIHALAWRADGGDPGELPPGISSGLLRLPDEGPAGGWRQDLASRFTAREWGPVHSWPSAVVRLEARAELARRLGVEEDRLQVVCPGDAPGRTPPEVLLDGARAPADVSLSHHGRFVAWAVRTESP